MKIVRENINEIRQDRESGLSSIGIGRAGMCKAFEITSNIDPRIKHLITLDSNQVVFPKELNEVPELIATALDTTLDKVGCVSGVALSDEALTYVSNILKRSKNTIADTQLLIHWPTNTNTLLIHTNEEKGICHIKYHEEDGKRRNMLFFRIP